MRNYAEYHLGVVSAVKKTGIGNEYLVFVQWEPLDHAESKWEPMSSILGSRCLASWGAACHNEEREIRRIYPSAAV